MAIVWLFFIFLLQNFEGDIFYETFLMPKNKIQQILC